MNLLFLIALISISISISILLVAPSHVFAILSNQTSSNQTATTNNLLKQILNELQQIHQLQQHPVLPTPSTAVPVPPFLSSPPPSFNATTCKPQNDNGVLIYPCPPIPTFPTLEQPSILPPTPQIPPFASIPIPPPFLAWLPPDLGMGPVTDCIYTVYGVFCPAN
jgi:hypothetical protein